MKLFKQYIIIITASFVWFSFVGNDKPKNGWEGDKLKGTVKTINEKSYSIIDSSGEFIKKYTYRIMSYSFDKRGYKYEEVFYDLDSIKYIYKYDEKGNVITKEENLRNSSIGLSIHFKYKYDDIGNKVEEESYEDTSLYKRSIYNYNKKGKLIKLFIYNSDSTLSSTHIYKYLKKGKEIESNFLHSDKSLDNRWYNKYDKKGNTIERVRYDSASSVKEKDNYKYDKNGNMLQWDRFDGRRDVTIKYIFKYQFDEKGNWIIKTKYKGGLIDSITERQITYY